ncbi:hypothetical protein CgunFtcFv8_002284 [Champsocephalus gunnari]|uniref:Uncharacterized protein n=1 Tax=Champsocephalus gunnari TaxID=52237 RepID=A0AAN8CMF9_CHAGU|nr:hypothetical protein CgunFtcFv8_002284 [Champsocephalus gunnari]
MWTVSAFQYRARLRSLLSDPNSSDDPPTEPPVEAPAKPPLSDDEDEVEEELPHEAHYDSLEKASTPPGSTEPCLRLN